MVAGDFVQSTYMMTPLVGDAEVKHQKDTIHEESMCCTTRTNLSRQHEEYFDLVLSQGKVEEAMEAFDMAFLSTFDRVVRVLLLDAAVMFG